MFSVLVIRLRSLRLLRVSGIVMRLRMFLLLITFLKASHSFRNRLLVICKNAYLFATMIMTSVSSQAGLRRDAVQPDVEAERKKRDEIEAGKSYCSRRFGGATCDDKSAQIYARFDKNDWRIQPAEFYRFHDAEVNTFGYF